MMRRGITLVVAMAALLVGCTSEPTPTQSSSPLPAASAAQCSGEDCTGREVAEVGCDKLATSVIERHVTAGPASGILALRMAHPPTCPDVFWARFIPDPTNTGAFDLSLMRDGTLSFSQASNPADPTITAWTVGIYGPDAIRLEACVRSGGEEQCLTNGLA